MCRLQIVWNYIEGATSGNGGPSRRLLLYEIVVIATIEQKCQWFSIPKWNE